MIDCIRDLEAAATAIEEQAVRQERWAQDTPAVAASIRERGQDENAAEIQACAEEFAEAAEASRAALEQLRSAIAHARAGHGHWKGYLRRVVVGLRPSREEPPAAAGGGA